MDADYPVQLPLAELVARRRAEMGLSLTELVKLVEKAAEQEDDYSSATPQWLSAIEHGRIPHPRNLRFLARALQLPLTPLAEAAKLQRMNRRQLLRSAVALGGGLTLPNRVWSLSAEQRSSRLDRATVTDMEAVTAAYRRAYRQLSVRTLLPQVKGHAAVLAELGQTSMTPTLRKRLIATTAANEALIGALLVMDLHSFDQSWLHLDRALSAAHDSEAEELEAYILGGMAFNACYSEDHYYNALRLIEAARKIAGTDNPPMTCAWLASVDSEIQARAGNAYPAEKALEDAENALQDLGEQNAASWIGIGAFNHAKLKSYRGLCYVLLDEPRKALDELTKALDALDTALKKHRCTALADQAAALVQLGEVEEGCQRASESLTLAIELRHAANADRIRKLRPKLDPWKKQAPVRALDEQLRAVVEW